MKVREAVDDRAHTGGRRAALRAARRALAQETHHLGQPWVADFPAFFWQQLRNRLQWTRSERLRASLAEQEAARCGPAFSRLWIRLLTRPTESESLLYALPGHGTRVWGCAFDQTGSRLASVGLDGTVRLWHLPDGRQIGSFSWGATGDPECCSFSPDGRLLAAGGSDGWVRVYDSDGRERTAFRGHSNRVSSCLFVPSGDRLVTASHDGAVRVWDCGAWELLHSCGIQGPGRYEGCDVSSDGRWIAAASSLGVVVLWDAREPRAPVLLEGHREWVRAVRFSPDASLLASAGDDGDVRLWDGSSRRLLRVIGAGRNAIYRCAWSSDGRLIASASDKGELLEWEAATGAPAGAYAGHSGVLDWCGYSADGALLASAGQDGVIRIWDATLGSPSASAPGHRLRVTASAVSSDGTLAATASLDNTVRLLGAIGGQPALALQGHDERVFACAFSPDGSLVASGDIDGFVVVSDVVTGVSQLSRRVTEKQIRFMAWDARSGSLLVACHDGALLRLRPESLDERSRTQAPVWLPGAWAYSPAAGLLATSSTALADSPSELVVWEPETGAVRARTGLDDGNATSCAFSADGRALVVGDTLGRVTVWDLVSRMRGDSFAAHDGWVECCGFLDAGLLVTGGGDHLLRVWDLGQGVPIAVLPLFAHDATCCSVFPSSRRAVVGDSAGDAHVVELAGHESAAGQAVV